MPRFKVPVKLQYTYEVEVMADNEDLAAEGAKEIALHGGLKPIGHTFIASATWDIKKVRKPRSKPARKVA